MKNTYAVAGYGDLIFDHYFQETPSGSLLYIDSRGGGPVWNVLANLSQYNATLIAYGVGGKNHLGELATHDLEKLGIDTSNVFLIEHKLTRIIHEKLKYSEKNDLPSHCFSSKCIVCDSRIEDRDLALTRKYFPKIEVSSDANFFIFDNITKDRIKCAADARERNSITLLDLGRISSLRYMPASAIVSSFNHFDIVFMPENVKESIRKRISIKEIDELLGITSAKAFFITNSESGVRIITNFNNKKDELLLPGVKPKGRVDNSGAGDQFMANIINGIFNKGVTNRSELLKSNCDILAQLADESISKTQIKLFSIGARGHLPKEWDIKFSGDKYVKVDSKEIALKSLRLHEECLFCGKVYNPEMEKVGKSQSKSFSKPPKPSIGQNTRNYLLKRVFFAIENSAAIEKCHELINRKGTTYVIGTGGSYAVAEFIAIALRVRHNMFAQAMRPLDYIECGSNSNNVLVVSYSGNTIDCAASIEHAKKLQAETIFLLTAGQAPLLRGYLRPSDIEINYSLLSNKHERGFVSIAGTIAPIALWCAAEVGNLNLSNVCYYALQGYDYFLEGVEEAVDKINEGYTVNIFGTGWAKPTMYDIESKFVEGDLAVARLHESKDFSHGRFMSIFKNRISENVSILVRCGKKQEYEDELSKKLRKHTLLLEIISEPYHDDILSAFSVIMASQFFIARVAEKLEKDISRPKYNNIHKDGLFLYNWNSNLIHPNR